MTHPIPASYMAIPSIVGVVPVNPYRSNDDLFKMFCEKNNVDAEWLLKRDRSRSRIKFRQACTYYLRTLTQKSLIEIGAIMRQDHSTIIHSVEQIKALCDTDPSFKLWLLSVHPFQTIKSTKH